MKKTLNPRTIAALRPAPAGRKYDVMDAVVPGFAVRVTDTGAKSYVLIKRMPGFSHPTRRTIARVGAMELQEARAVARKWLEQVLAGVDPRAAVEAEIAIQARAEENTADALIEVYIATRLQKQVKRDEIARALRREFAQPWAGRAVEDIQPADVAAIVTAKAKTAPTQAHLLLSHIKSFFNWCVAGGKIRFSPAAPVKASSLLGPLEPRTRVLSDEELKRLWHSADTLGYPLGPFFRLLILTGLRLNEGADATWDEIDMKRGIWTIPAPRMKGRIDHAIPITAMLRDLLDGLPRLEGGPYLFSTGDGSKSLWVSEHHRGKVDVAARVYDWRNHDIKRTFRTHLSKIPSIPEHVREIMIAHKRTGIARVYDRADHLEEKKVGFEAWHARLRAIVSGAPTTNVVAIRRKRAATVAAVD